MSHATQPVFVHKGTWDGETRSHPAMKWLEDFTVNDFDKKDWTKCAQTTTADYIYHKANGTIFKGSDVAWKQIAEDYAMFADQNHEPTHLVAWETSEGWEMTGEVNVFFKLQAPLPETETDAQGNKWHGVAFGAYHFVFVKESGEIKMKLTRIYADPSPIMKLMLKNNFVNAEQIAGMLGA